MEKPNEKKVQDKSINHALDLDQGRHGSPSFERFWREVVGLLCGAWRSDAA